MVCLLSFAMCIGYSFTSLTFLADRSALVDSGEHMTQISNAFQKEFPNNSDIVVLVDGGKNEEREQFVDELAKRLSKHPELYPDIFVKVELPFLKSHALSYLEANDLGKLVASLKDAKGMMNALNDQAGIGSMLSHSSKDLETMLPILNEIIGQFLKSLQTRGRYRYDSPWEKAFFESASEASDASQNDVMKEAGKTSFYNTVARGEKHLVLVKPGEDTGASIDFPAQRDQEGKTELPDSGSRCNRRIGARPRRDGELH